MVRVSLSGQGMGQGDSHCLLRTVWKEVLSLGGHRMVQAQLPHQGPSCRWGLGLPLKREGGVSWLPGGCTPQVCPCSTTHSSVLEPVISHAPPKQVLTPVLDTPQPHTGVPTPPLEPPAVLLLWLQLPPPTLGKMRCPDPAARSSAVRESPA